MKNWLKKTLLSDMEPRRRTRLLHGYYDLHSLFAVRRHIRGADNTFAHRNAHLTRIVLAIDGSHNRILCRPDAILRDVIIRMRGSHHILEVGSGAYLSGITLAFEDDHCRILIGERTVMYERTRISAAERGMEVHIGADCLLAQQVDIRTTDSHGLWDRADGRRLNPGGSVRIGSRVWLGERVTVLKGVSIGEGSVVGINALVTKDLPPRSVSAGIPARVVRENILWTFSRDNRGTLTASSGR